MLPGIMSVLIALMWLLLIVVIALILDVYHNFYLFQGLNYMLEIFGVAMLVYLTISLTTAMHLWIVSLILSIIYIIAFIYIYIKYVRCRYICGACGARLIKKGVCPYCGKNNKWPHFNWLVFLELMAVIMTLRNAHYWEFSMANFNFFPLLNL